MTLSSDAITFCLLSFEGPDPYSRAGGLGVRVTHLAETLAQLGFETHLLFVGDPAAPGLESRLEGRLILHRWCQWISAYHPAGVYDAEEAKLWDFVRSVPPFVIEQVIRPALEAGRMPVILAEEWHTAETLIRLSDQLHAAGLRRRCVLFWNANNTISFHRIDWPRLNYVAQLTTVSRYMKHLMWTMGLNPLVIPNGIPDDLLEPVDEGQVAALKHVLSLDEDTLMLFKVGRFDPAKRWLMAVEAAAQLKAEGYRVVFPMRGGIEPHGAEVLARARDLGLTVADVTGEPTSWDELLTVLHNTAPVNLYNLRFPMSQTMLRPFYVAADAVLANSGREPFGLVGLEAMAAGGLVFTGATGEEYALDGESAVVLDTNLPQEIVAVLLDLHTRPTQTEEMRYAARKAAAAFTWKRISKVLLEKIEFAAQADGALPRHNGHSDHRSSRRVRDVVAYTVVHQPWRLRLPAQGLQPDISPEAMAQYLFDESLNERYFRRVAARCYEPAVAQFQSLVEEGLKLSIGFSWSFIEQARRWGGELLDRFRHLVNHNNVELVAVEPRHSFVLLWDIPRFIDQMRLAADQLEQVFGVRPVVADTAELMMSDTIYHALDQAGFRAAFMDGRSWVLDWRQPTYLYHHNGGQTKLLARHPALSDDVGYRFSDRNWSGWPLWASHYADWLAECPGDLVVLGWDFETFGEHHAVETGIFDFLRALPREVRRAGLTFVTPSDALEHYGRDSNELPLPAFASTWAGSGGLEFFLGNDAQWAVFRLMVQAYSKACLTKNPVLIELALRLAQSDNLHLIQWFGRHGSEAEVSAYFTPQEWWSLGPERIVWEIQQVYKNFIAATDAYLPACGGEIDKTCLRSVACLEAVPLP